MPLSVVCDLTPISQTLNLQTPEMPHLSPAGEVGQHLSLDPSPIVGLLEESAPLQFPGGPQESVTGLAHLCTNHGPFDPFLAGAGGESSQRSPDPSGNQHVQQIDLSATFSSNVAPSSAASPSAPSVTQLKAKRDSALEASWSASPGSCRSAWMAEVYLPPVTEHPPNFAWYSGLTMHVLQSHIPWVDAFDLPS